MRARNKLNGFYLFGCLLAAIVIGFVLQSWLAFFVALAVLISVSVRDGAIRFTQQPRPRQGFHVRQKGKREFR